jgi:hypothetical protein
VRVLMNLFMTLAVMLDLLNVMNVVQNALLLVQIVNHALMDALNIFQLISIYVDQSVQKGSLVMPLLINAMIPHFWNIALTFQKTGSTMLPQAQVKLLIHRIQPTQTQSRNIYVGYGSMAHHIYVLII